MTPEDSRTRGRADTWIDAPSSTVACSIIGEVAQAHDGSLGTAHAFIDAIADAGADAVKFQTHIASEESTPAEPWRARFSLQDESRYDYWRRMEFTREQWRGLREHCDTRGVRFLSTPFSPAAVDLLKDVGVAAWKVASGEIDNLPMLAEMARTGLPMILSTGMSDLDEVARTVDFLRGFDVSLAVLQCSTRYPCPAENVGLNVIDLFRRRFETAVGLSDHSGKVFPGLAASCLGAQVIEVHVTLDRRMFGPDVPASLTPEELALLVEGVRFNERMLKHPVDKSALAPEVAEMRGLFMKSVTALENLKAGTALGQGNVGLRKPGGGIPASAFGRVLGRHLRRDVRKHESLAWGDLEDT